MNNPLDQYYRTKEIYVKLPTQGKWYKDKPNLTDQGEIGILPMTVRDEMLLNIPDTLFNGESLFELFKSIAPDIKDPYEICMPDVDVILLGSRAASYENKLEVESRCPHCETYNQYEIELSSILSQIKVIDESEIEIGELIFVLKPNTLKTVNAANIQSIENQRMIEMMFKNQNGEQPLDQETFNRSLEISTASAIAIVADAISEIKLPDGKVVTEFEYIAEFLSKTQNKTVDTLKRAITNLNENGIGNDFNFTCSGEECGKSYNSPVEFNPAFFFKKP